jgi:hypothetical protein
MKFAVSLMALGVGAFSLSSVVSIVHASVPLLAAAIGVLSSLSAAFAAVPLAFPRLSARAKVRWTLASKWCGTFAVDLGRGVRILQRWIEK